MAFIAILLFLPVFVSAQGIVPQCDGNDCQAFHLVQLAQNIINWLITISVFVAVGLIAYAGFQLVISGGNQSARTQAHSMVWSVVIGFIIMLSAWLVVDIFLRVLTGDGLNSSRWEIEYVEQPEFKDGQEILVPGGSGGAGGSGSGDPGTATGNGSCEAPGTGPCSEAALSGVWGSQAANAGGICNAESAANPRRESQSDRMRANNLPFSVGLFQINLTVHKLSCGGTTYDCPAAFSGKNYSATIANRELYDTCVEKAKDPDCNTQNAKRIFDEAGGSWQPWSTKTKCGL